MGIAENMGFIKQAQSELKKRIDKTVDICEQFRRSDSGYTSNIKPISLLVILGMCVLVLVYIIFNADVILKYSPMREYDRNSLLFKLSLAGICVYMGLHIYKIVLRVLRIAKIDSNISAVLYIKRRLESKLKSLTAIATDIENKIYANTNEKIIVKEDIDTEITKYSSLVRAYSNRDNNAFSLSITLTHWLSGVLFSCVFLLISTSFVAAKAGELFNINNHNLISFCYMAVFFIIYMILQEFFARSSIKYVHNKIKNIFGYLLIAGICAVFVFIVFETGREYLFDNTMETHQFGEKSYTFARIFSGFIPNQSKINFFRLVVSMSKPFLPLLISVAFISIIGIICKLKKIIINIIGIIYSLGVLGVLLYLIFGLSFVQFINDVEGIASSMDMESAMVFVLVMVMPFIPFMIAVFFASLISIIGRINSISFGSILLWIGVIYVFISFFISLSYDSNKINCALIGDLIIWAIILIMYGVLAAVALLPGIIPLFISALASKNNAGNNIISSIQDNFLAKYAAVAIKGGGIGWIGGIAGAIALYVLAFLVETLACFIPGWRCGNYSCNDSVLGKVWTISAFSNTVFFLMIAGFIVGTIYIVAKHIQEYR